MPYKSNHRLLSSELTALRPFNRRVEQENVTWPHVSKPTTREHKVGIHVYFINSKIDDSYISQEEITHRVELEYRLFLWIDSSLYRPKTIFVRGCAKFRPLAFLKIKYYGRRYTQISLNWQ